MPALPDPTWWPYFIKDAILIAIIAFSINISLAILLSQKHDYNINIRQVTINLRERISSFFS